MIKLNENMISGEFGKNSGQNNQKHYSKIQNQETIDFDLEEFLRIDFFSSYVYNTLEDTLFFRQFIDLKEQPTAFPNYFFDILNKSPTPLRLDEKIFLKTTKDDLDDFDLEQIKHYNNFTKQCTAISMPDLFPYLIGVFPYHDIFKEYNGRKDFIIITQEKILVAYKEYAPYEEIDLEKKFALLSPIALNDKEFYFETACLNNKNRLRLPLKNYFKIEEDYEEILDIFYQNLATLYNYVNELIDHQDSEGVRKAISYALKEIKPALFE